MSEYYVTTIVTTIYKIVTVVAGLAIVYLGYRLLCKGIYDKTGEIEVIWGNMKLLLKRATPGAIFAVLGVTVMWFSIWRGLNIKYGDQPKTPSNVDAIKYSIEAIDGFSLPPSLSEVDTIMNKLLEGKKVSGKEGEILKNWLELTRSNETKRNEMRWEFRAFHEDTNKRIN